MRVSNQIYRRELDSLPLNGRGVWVCEACEACEVSPQDIVSSPMERGHGGNAVSPAHLEFIKKWMKAELSRSGRIGEIDTESSSRTNSSKHNTTIR